MGAQLAPQTFTHPQGYPLPSQRLAGTLRWGTRQVTACRLLSGENLGRAGPKVPAGLLSQAGDRQCSLGELGEGGRGKTNGHTRDMQEAQACVGGGVACGVGGGQQHEQYPAGGPGWAPGPHGRIHPTLLPFACLGLALPPPRHICLAPSWLASLPVSAPLLWGRSSAAPFSRS